MKLKRTLFMCLLLTAMLGVLAACGCGKKDTESGDTTTEVPVAVSSDVSTGVVSLLTGEEIDEEYENSRPVAIMIPNDNYGALPQYGLSYAGVVYEVPVEAPYTRLMAIFDEAVYKDLQSIGPIRSCRLYYCYFALEFDAIYAHYGESSYAKSFLNSGEIDHMDGLSGTISSIVYSRDSSRSEPDNVFTSGEKLLAGIEYCEFRTEYEEGYEGHYNFADEEITNSDGTVAEIVKPGYSLSEPWFEYNSEDGLYYRYEYSSAQKDALNGEQIAVKNIIIQACDYTILESHNTYNFDTLAGGEGYYITNGTAIHVTWTKSDQNSPAVYYDDAGNEIEINTGNTWVCVVCDDDFADIELSAASSEDSTEAAE